VAFPKAVELPMRRYRVAEVHAPAPELRYENDAAVLVLDELLPVELVARLRRPAVGDLPGRTWWTFGYPEGDMLGDSAFGRVGESLSFGWVRLDVKSASPIKPGFSGGPLWCSDYEAIVGLVGQAQRPGSTSGPSAARALTLFQIDKAIPSQKLHLLTDWSAEAAGESALAAWGWSLEVDQEAVRHWRPRARGVSTDAERGFRFRGRSRALQEIISWITHPNYLRRALIVTGSPGVGKSAVLGRIVTSADRLIAAALPAADEAVRAPIGSVACAVHAKGKSAIEVAREIARAGSAPLPDLVGDLIPRLRSVLDERQAQGDHRLFAVVIDALDEAASPEQARIIVNQIVSPLADTCGEQIRIVVGGRRRDDAGDLFETVAPEGQTNLIDLDSPSYFHHEDLAAYAQATLQLIGDERADNPYADADVAHPVADRIATLASRQLPHRRPGRTLPRDA
jgi:hypothetical protein